MSIRQLTSTIAYSRVTLYTAGRLHTTVPHCSHSRAPIVHTAVPWENNDHGCVYLRCRAVCKLPGCVEGHPCYSTAYCRTGERPYISKYIYILYIYAKDYIAKTVGLTSIIYRSYGPCYLESHYLSSDDGYWCMNASAGGNAFICQWWGAMTSWHWNSALTHWGLVTPFGDRDLGQHWIR